MTFTEENDSRIPKAGCMPAVFRCAAPHARSVFLAGDFNGWSDYASPVQKSADGFWTATLELPPGRYEFKFVVDGHWFHEAGADGPFDGRKNSSANAFGTMNHVIEVGVEVSIPAYQLGAVGIELMRRGE